MHKSATESLSAERSEHSSEEEDGVVGIEAVSWIIESVFGSAAEESCVSNDFRSSREVDVRGKIVDIIFVKVYYTLFLRENGITRFEDFVYLGG